MAKKVLLVFDHVLGASIAMSNLKDRGVITTMDDMPQEGDAKLYIDEDDYERGVEVYEEWMEEVRSRFGLLSQ